MRSRLALGLTLQYAIGGSFLPFLVRYFLDRGLSFEYEIPTIFTGVAVVSATMPILWGVLADRFVAVNRLIATLHAVGAVSLLLVASSESFAMMFLGTILWFSCGLPTNSLLNALCYHNLASPKAEFGRLRMWGSVGWILPSLPAAIWLSVSETGDLGFLLYLGAAVELLFVVVSPILPFTPPPHRRARGEDPGRPRLSFSQSLSRLLPRPEFLLLLVVSFLMFWSFNIVFYYSPIYLEDQGLGREWIMPIQSLGPVVEIPLFFFLPRVLARIGFFATLACGCLLILLRQVLFATSTDPAVLCASYMLVGAAVVFYLITVSLKIDAMAGREVRSSAQTLLLISSHGLGTLVAHLTTGQLVDQEDLSPIFSLGIALAGLALVFLAAAAVLERRRVALAPGLTAE